MDPKREPGHPVDTDWFFRPRAGVAHGSLAVFVPAQNALGVSDHAVYAGDPATSVSIGTIPVSQAAGAGQWVTLGSYPVSGTLPEIQGPGSPGHGNGHGPGRTGRTGRTGRPGGLAAWATTPPSPHRLPLLTAPKPADVAGPLA